MGFVILRVDGSNRIGIGHIMRCIALAEGFTKAGVKSVFVVKDDEQKVSEFIRDKGYVSEIIPKDSSCSEDALLTLRFADRCSAKTIVTDISNINTLSDMRGYQGYLQKLKDAGKYLITIDGFGDDCISDKFDISCDIVIIPYYGAQDKRYKTNSNTKLLLGPSFFIFRQEFSKAVKIPREISKNVDNILISMGGADPTQCSIKVVNALIRLGRPYLNFKVTIGASFTAELKRGIENTLEKVKCGFEVILQSNDMAQLLHWADLAILSSGLTLYEAAATQTPAIVLSQYPYHEEIMNGFSEAGSFWHLGYGPQVSEETIVKAIEQLSGDFARRREMAYNGSKLVNGKGVERVISNIPKEMIV